LSSAHAWSALPVDTAEVVVLRYSLCGGVGDWAVRSSALVNESTDAARELERKLRDAMWSPAEFEDFVQAMRRSVSILFCTFIWAGSASQMDIALCSGEQGN